LKSLKLIFMGTPGFAIPSLEAVHRSRHLLDGVVTRPDKPRGRGRRLQLAPVAEWARRYEVELAQPGRVDDRSFQAWLKEKNPDVIVTVAFGGLLPREILDLPSLGCINLHASYLPAYRGAAPIHRAVMEGATYSGVSVIKMTQELDAGDIVMREKESVSLSDTAGTLHDRLAEKGAGLLVRALDGLADGTLEPVPQDHDQATYAPSLQPGEECLDWNLGPVELYNRIRGLNPWPGAYTVCEGKRIKVWLAEWPGEKANGTRKEEPGTVIEAHENALVVATGHGGALKLIEVQPAGKRAMDAGSFCCGYRIEPGHRLSGE